MKKKTRSDPPAALLAQALQSQLDGVIVTDGETDTGGLRILYANPNFCRMTGYPASRLKGRRHGTLHVEDSDVDSMVDWLRKAKSGDSLSGEGRLRRRDGFPVDVAWSVVVFSKKGRLPSHAIATYRDITERRQRERSLLHSERLEALGRMAGGIAHDYNNLTSVVNGYSQILANRLGANSVGYREIQEIYQAGQKAADLTRQLLAFGRQQKIEPRVVDLNMLIEQHVDVLHQMVGPAGELKFSLHSRPAPVLGEPAQLQQVLFNLVNNARDALREKGRVKISTAIRRVRPSLNRRITDVPLGDYVVLTISDNGTGMDRDTQAHLFEPFYTTKAEGRGTGLGLAMVYGVIQQCRGFINVQSAPQVGTTFEIMLPLSQGPAAPLSQPPPPLPEVKGHETVLVIEDDDMVARMVSGLLQSSGYRVLVAARAGNGIEAIVGDVSPIHLLIAPINSADGDGARLVRQLMESHSGLRVLNTGQADSPSVRGINRGRQEKMAKPYSLSDLLLAVRRLLDA